MNRKSRAFNKILSHCWVVLRSNLSAWQACKFRKVDMASSYIAPIFMRHLKNHKIGNHSKTGRKRRNKLLKKHFETHLKFCGKMQVWYIVSNPGEEEGYRTFHKWCSNMAFCVADSQLVLMVMVMVMTHKMNAFPITKLCVYSFLVLSPCL